MRDSFPFVFQKRREGGVNKWSYLACDKEVLSGYMAMPKPRDQPSETAHEEEHRFSSSHWGMRGYWTLDKVL